MNLNQAPIDGELEIDYDHIIRIDNDKVMDGDGFSVETELTPKIGLIFENLEESKTFWEKYSRVNGFGAKIRSSSKRKGIVRHRMHACSREGEKYKKEGPVISKPHGDTRCYCPARMGVSLIKNTEMYRVVSFISEHNHVLEDKRTTHPFRSNRSIDTIQACSIDIAEGACLGPKRIHRLMSLEAGGSENVGFTKEEIKSYLRKPRKKNVGLEKLQAIHDYFSEQSQKNPSFFHDYQVDIDGLLTNFFWADSKMILDYETFGDVLSFDTTFGTNKLTRPLAIFSGFNNHRQIVIFGLALLYDSTALSFGWVMQSFIRCHKEKQPRVIYTDQEKAMEIAIGVVMPETRHALCTWHLGENAMKSKSLKKDLQGKMAPFIVDLHKFMNEYGDVIEFEEQWKVLLNTYGLYENEWIKEFYEKKEKWGLAYLKDVFLAGTRTTQMSESVNSMFKKDFGSGYLTMRKKFRGLNLFLKTIRDNELESDFKSRQTSPYLAISHSPILKHVASIYTPKMFMHFQKQFDAEYGVRLSTNALINVAHDRIAYQDGLAYKINYNPIDATISCSCCMYETHGYICSHILRVFNISDVNQIPEKYILKRWTREAKRGHVYETFANSKLDAQEIRTALCSEFNRLVYRVGSNKCFANAIRRLIQECNMFIDGGEVKESNIRSEDVNAQCHSAYDQILRGVTGLKTKERKKTGPKRRMRSCLENKSGPAKRKNKNKKNVQEKDNATNNVGIDYFDVGMQTSNGPNMMGREGNNVFNNFGIDFNVDMQTSNFGLPPNTMVQEGNNVFNGVGNYIDYFNLDAQTSDLPSTSMNCRYGTF